MKKSGQFFLFGAIICWAGIVGAFLYSHIATLPSLLLHLPESSVLANGPYPIRDEIFWKMIHPIAILFTILALISNWGIKDRRKLIGIAMIIYILSLVATFTFFVPELLEFFKSSHNTTITASEWYERGQRWLYLSWIRGSLMLFGFSLLLLALTKYSLSERKV